MVKGSHHKRETIELLKKVGFQKGKSHSPENQFKKGVPPWNKGKHMPQIMGEKHPNWKGGYWKKEQIRKTLEYKLWRESVFNRDNYTCVWCGDNRGGNLEADHIKPFALFPELRLAIDNGRTLCKNCHKKTDTYAGKGIKRSIK